MILKRTTIATFVVGLTVICWNLNSIRERGEQVKGLTTRMVDRLATPLPPCGQVCTYTGKIVNATSKPYPQLYKEINCKNIMKRMAYRYYVIEKPPPKYPPDHLLDEFTMGGKMPITKIKYFVPGPTTVSRSFSKSYLDTLIDKVGRGVQVNGYKAAGRCVESTLKRYGEEIERKRGVVIGTLQPWLEAILLAYGASGVTTLEYSKLELEDDRLRVFTPYDFADRYVSGDVDLFDFGATFSSMEHSGLGRYTDPLNPYGDLEAMAQVWCMLKPGGLFMLGLPCTRNERGFILWNANRMYGLDRVQQMTANWELLELVRCTDSHDVFVLRKPKEK